MVAIQVAHPALESMNRADEFLKMQPCMSLPSTTLLIDPLMKITGRAIPKATLLTVLPAESNAGLETS